MEIKSLPAVAGTMEGGLWIGQSSLRTTQGSVCVYINIPLLREEKEKKGLRTEKGQEQGGVYTTGSKGKVHREIG